MEHTTITITITFSESVENHVGMEIVGKKGENGFFLKDLIEAKRKFEEEKFTCELYNLGLEEKNDTYHPAFVLVVRNFASGVLSPQTDKDLLEEQLGYNWDTTMYSRKHAKHVVNKLARHNVCYADNSQEPDIENKKGTIISFTSVPLLNKIRNTLPLFLGEKGDKLYGEGNKYYDKKCGIGFHGDTERKKVIGLRLGKELDLHYQWYYKFNPTGKRIKIKLNSGDLYIMSDKAVGYDWKKSSILTLRHSTGSDKYTNPNKEKLVFVDPKDLVVSEKELLSDFCNYPNTEIYDSFSTRIKELIEVTIKYILKNKKGNLRKARDILKYIQ